MNKSKKIKISIMAVLLIVTFFTGTFIRIKSCELHIRQVYWSTSDISEAVETKDYIITKNKNYYVNQKENDLKYKLIPEIDSWVMKDTAISELVEDEKQKLLYVFDYITERCFFIELSEIITGKDMNGAKCTKKSGDAPKQTVDFEEMAAASGSLDLDENFYGDQDFDMEDFDQEGFDIGGDASTPYEEEKF